MKSSASIPMKASSGFSADPDPSTNPADVPTTHVFRCPESLPVDGAPNALQLWLAGAAATETAAVEVWGLDDSSNVSDDSSTPSTQVFKPNASQRWAKLAAALTVTAPTVQAATGRLFSGLLYVRQTGSTLSAAGSLKVACARL